MDVEETTPSLVQDFDVLLRRNSDASMASVEPTTSTGSMASVVSMQSLVSVESTKSMDEDVYMDENYDSQESSSSSPYKILQLDFKLLQKENEELNAKFKNLKKAYKTMRQDVRRKKAKNTKLNTLLRKKNKRLADSIKKEKLNKIPPTLRALFNRIIEREDCEKRSTKPYCEDLKRFSIELDFISPKAFR